MNDRRFVGAHVETPRALLRPFGNQDLSAFVDIASEKEVLAFLPSTDRMTPLLFPAMGTWHVSGRRRGVAGQDGRSGRDEAEAAQAVEPG